MRKFFISLLVALTSIPAIASEFVSAAPNGGATHMLAYSEWTTNVAGIILVCAPKDVYAAQPLMENSDCRGDKGYFDVRRVVPPGRSIIGYQVVGDRWKRLLVWMR